MAAQANTSVKALVFDAYGTLFDVHSVAALADRLFPGKGDALSQLWRNRQLQYTWLLSLMDRYEDFAVVTEKALVFACASLGLACPPATRAQLMNAYLELSPLPGVHDALARVSRVPLAILSNGSPGMLAPLVKNAGLEGRFTHVISADARRVYKPSPRVYQLGPDTLGLPAASIGFVSSNSFDAQGAKAFGYTTFWVNATGSVAEELGFTPDATLSNLRELEGKI
jgi:2-haloacid dehalogenase